MVDARESGAVGYGVGVADQVLLCRYNPEKGDLVVGRITEVNLYELSSEAPTLTLYHIS